MNTPGRRVWARVCEIFVLGLGRGMAGLRVGASSDFSPEWLDPFMVPGDDFCLPGRGGSGYLKIASCASLPGSQ